MSIGIQNETMDARSRASNKIVLYGILAHENSKRSSNIFLKSTFFMSWILDVLSKKTTIKFLLPKVNDLSIHF